MHHVCLLAGFASVGLLLNKDEFDDLVQNHAKLDSPLLDIVLHPAASSSPSLAFPSHPTKGHSYLGVAFTLSVSSSSKIVSVRSTKNRGEVY